MRLSAGAEYDVMYERRRGYINNNGVVGALKRDEDNTVNSTAIYAQGEWEFVRRWTLHAGARYTRVNFDSSDYFIGPGNPNDSGSRSYQAVGRVVVPPMAVRLPDLDQCVRHRQTVPIQDPTLDPDPFGCIRVRLQDDLVHHRVHRRRAARPRPATERQGQHRKRKISCHGNTSSSVKFSEFDPPSFGRIALR